MYSDNPGAENIMEKIGLASKVEPGPGDYLLLVDSVINSKLDRLMNKSLEFSRDLSDPSNPCAGVHIRYENPKGMERPAWTAD